SYDAAPTPICTLSLQRRSSDLRVAPLWKDKFVQQFHSRGNAWRDFIACAKRLAEFAFPLGEITSFPYRFKCCIISEDKRSKVFRSEEHTSELQSRFDLVCRLLL